MADGLFDVRDCIFDNSKESRMAMGFANIFGKRSARTSSDDVERARDGNIALTISTPPPSLNNSFHNVAGVGRVKSKRYRRWIKDAGWEIAAQRAAPMKGPVFVFFELGERSSRADADNLIKAMFDLLVAHGLIESDAKKCVRGYAVRWIVGARDFRIAVVTASAAS